MSFKVLICSLVILIGAACSTGSNGDTELNQLRIQYSALTTRDLNALQDFESTFNIHKIWIDIKVKILSVWNKLVESAKITKDHFAEWFNNVKSQADEIITKAKRNIKEKEADVRGKLKEMAAKAKKFGVDIKECLQGQVDKVIETTVDSISKLGSCIGNEVGIADDIVGRIGNIIESTLDIRNIVKNRLGECRHQNNTRMPKCLLEVSREIINEVANISSEVTQSASLVKDIIGKLQTALPTCTAQNGLNISMQFTRLTVEVENCVKAKMDASNKIDNKPIYLLD